MFSKPLCTIFAKNYITTLSSAANRNLLTKCRLQLVPTKFTSLEGEIFKRFAASPRTIVRQEPGLVRLGFIPDEWFTFFFPKTGVSGLGTFAVTFSTYLMSKEYYVMEHEYYGGLSLLIVCVLATKYVGPPMAKYLDKEVDAYEKSLTDLTANTKKALEDAIKHEEQLQWSCEGQLGLIEAKRENIALQLEAAYRERLMKAYVATRKQLQYCVERQEVEKAIVKRHMISWVVKEVSKELSDEIEKASVNKCLQDLEKLSQSFKLLTTEYPPLPPDKDEKPPKPKKPDPAASKPKPPKKK